MLTILSSCSATERLNKASTARGTIEASVVLPVYPDDCRKKEPHASLEVGAELRSILVRERSALERQNSRTDRCAGFYDSVTSKYGR